MTTSPTLLPQAKRRKRSPVPLIAGGGLLAALLA